MQEQEKAVISNHTAQELQDSIERDTIPLARDYKNTGIKIHKKTAPDPSRALGAMPQEIYSKEEYCSDSMLYLIMPQHEVAIPYGRAVTPKLLETIAHTLVQRGDLRSSQVATDYPIVTHVQLELWYSSYTMIEQLKVIEVYKPRKALSGWEERKRSETRRDHSVSVKAAREFREKKADMFDGGAELQPQPTSYRLTPDRRAEIKREGK